MGDFLTISSKGQLTLPKKVREATGLERGRQVRCYVNSNGWIVLIPLTKSFDDLVGILPKPDAPLSIEEMDERMQTAVASHVLGEPGDEDQ